MLKLFPLVIYLSLAYSPTCGDPRGARVRRIVGGVPAEVPPADDPVVFVKYNGKFARIEGTRNPNEYHYHFRGLRFAHPPTGKQRFQRPKAFTLEGEVNATQYPPPCMQPQPRTNSVVGSEDCLFLNVYTPDLPDGTEGLPVVVWIHGGGFRYGSASQYGVQNLVNKRVVLVTLQYRLGTLGFLSSGERDLPGNAGLFDMALAVLWVRHYIGFFGGNPSQIVVMGHGTGATSAMLVCLSNIAKGLTSAIVAMSGTAVSNWAVDNEPKNVAIEVAERHGCPTTNTLTMVSCLRAVSAEDIIRGDSMMERNNLRQRGFISGLSGLLTPSPVSEGRNDGRSLPGFLQTKPLQALQEGDVPRIPLLTGVTKDETGHAINGQFRNEIVNKLGSIPNFLDKVLVGSLQECTGFGQMSNENKTTKSSILSTLNPLNFKNYFTVGKNNVKQAFSKICEATGDVLFNLPAFLTADLWSKKCNETFLYRFEHVGKSFKGYHFLQGVPIVGNDSKDTNTSEEVVGHGDELGYLFTPQNLDGSPLPVTSEETEEDIKVRDIFTDMIYKFVKYSRIEIENKTVPHFSESANNYIGISAYPKLLNDFRFCQIGLWAGITERLQTSTCKFLSTVEEGLQGVENVLFETVNSSGAVFNENAQKIGSSITDTLTGKQFKTNPVKGKPSSPNVPQNANVLGLGNIFG